MKEENGWSRWGQPFFYGAVSELFAFVEFYLRLWNFICVREVLFALRELYLRSRTSYLRSTKFDTESGSPLLWFLAFRTVKSALSFGIRLLRLLGEIYARSWLVTLVREAVTRVQQPVTLAQQNPAQKPET